MKTKLLLLLLLNFGGLAIGSFLMGEGPTSNWYRSLNQAPWTPPGWVFGVAWTSIMICFSFYISKLLLASDNHKPIYSVFGLSWVLNVVWNPIFFHFHQTMLGLIVILSLTLIIGFFLFTYAKTQRVATLLILPYFIWLIVASSLNFYIVVKN